MTDAAAKWVHRQNRVTQATDTTSKALTDTERKLRDNQEALLPIIQQSESWAKQLTDVNNVLGKTAELAEMMGGKIGIAGQSFQDLTEQGIRQAVEMYKTAFRK